MRIINLVSQFVNASPRVTNVALLLISVCLSCATFLVFDRLHTKIVEKPVDNWSCVVVDPIRTHALKPSCAGKRRWGKDTYDFFTNNLGFRDERVRVVPPADPRPRIVLLGDSFTESETSWSESYAGKLAARFPQYEILNGGVTSYAPSNYLNVVRFLLREHVEFDEVFVFIDISDVQDEAAYYRDVGASGAVAGPEREDWTHISRYHTVRATVAKKFLLTNYVVDLLERAVVEHGWYYLFRDQDGNIFDLDRSAWTYRKVPETVPYVTGYAPLGVEGGIAKEKAKMTLLWQALAAHHIALNVVVYPWPAQVVHDTADSWQVQIWRDWCSGKCKDFISVFPAFLAERNRCSRIEPGCWYVRNFIFGDFHYNAAGNTLVADAVTQSLLAAPARKRYSAGE